MLTPAPSQAMNHAESVAVRSSFGKLMMNKMSGGGSFASLPKNAPASTEGLAVLMLISTMRSVEKSDRLSLDCVTRLQSKCASTTKCSRSL